MKVIKKLLTVFLACSMCLGSAASVMADDGSAGAGESRSGEATVQSVEGTVASGSDGTLVTDLPVDKDILITLADDRNLRWNANGAGLTNNVIHLDTYEGSNCSFSLCRVKEDGHYTDYYGIRYEGTKLFADIDGKSTKDGAFLHLYTPLESELADNPHRQFAFYLVKTDDNGNNYFYIKNRKSGLWMGYEDKNKSGGADPEEKICQTTAEKRKMWIITNGVVPKQGGEAEDLVEFKEGSTTDKEGGVFVSLFKKDTIESVTSNGDMAVKGTNLHFYRMGTNSKMLLKWDNQHSAYEILYYTDGENYRDAVWDLENEGAQENADVHLWDRESKTANKNTSQLWRFYRQDDKSYLIQNARTGKYIGYQYDKDDEGKDLVSSGTLKQLDGKEGTFGDDVRKLAYFTLDRFAGEDNPVNFNYSEDWMAGIPDDALVSSINIPGTHDTGTASVNFDASGQASLSSCQKYYYGEQLNVGARSFDVRCDAGSDDPSLDDIKIVHGSSLVVCHERGTNFTSLTLKSLLDDSIRFLQNHSSETIILTVKRDAGSEIGLAKALGKFIEKNKKYFWLGDTIPTMGEARGKIILFRRYSADYNYKGDGVELQWFGPDLTSWDDHSYSDYKYAIPIYNDGRRSVYVQDAFNEGSSSKLDFIKGTLRQTTGADKSHEIPGNAWVYNYTSCAGGFPLGLTRDINPWLYSGDGSSYFDNRRVGMVMLNFIDCQMSRLVYETNFNKGSFFELKSSAPTKVEWPYGEPIGDAKISGQTGKGTWTFDNPEYVPTYEDYKSGKKFKMIFTPDDTKTYRTVSAEVKITDLVRRPISVDISDRYMTYGEEVPELTFRADTSQLVTGDSVSDLKVSLDIDKYYSTTGRLRAGQYKIKGTSNSTLYDVTFTSTGKYNGSLIVYRSPLEVKWSDTSNLVYTGSHVNVTAEIKGVLEGDDCSVYVTGGREIGPSWNGDKNTAPEIYTATAHVTGEDRLNYILPEDDDDKEYQTSKKYYIRRDDPGDFSFPVGAVMTYGEMLSDAELELASGDGKFVFVKDRLSGKDIGDTVPEAAGTYEYLLKYIPSDPGVKPAYKELKVIVKSKTVSLVWPEKTEYKYTGKPVNITVRAVGLLYGDKCRVKVINGCNTKPGTYVAQVVSLTNDNYRLPEDERMLSMEYTIVKASDDGDDDDSGNGDDGDSGDDSGGGNGGGDKDNGGKDNGGSGGHSGGGSGSNNGGTGGSTGYYSGTDSDYVDSGSADADGDDLVPQDTDKNEGADASDIKQKSDSEESHFALYTGAIFILLAALIIFIVYRRRRRDI